MKNTINNFKNFLREDASQFFTCSIVDCETFQAHLHDACGRILHTMNYLYPDAKRMISLANGDETADSLPSELFQHLIKSRYWELPTARQKEFAA